MRIIVGSNVRIVYPWLQNTCIIVGSNLDAKFTWDNWDQRQYIIWDEMYELSKRHSTSTFMKFWDWRLESRHPQEHWCLTRCRVTRRTLKYINILPQNNCRLKIVAFGIMHIYQRWYSCWKHRWNMLAGRSRTESLVAVMTSSIEWNLCPHRSTFMRGKTQKSRKVRDHVSTEGVTKRWLVALQIPLGQGQSDAQGRCRSVTANYSYAKAQDAYVELNRVNDKESPCSIFCLLLPFLGWIPCEQFHLN